MSVNVFKVTFSHAGNAEGVPSLTTSIVWVGQQKPLQEKIKERVGEVLSWHTSENCNGNEELQLSIYTTEHGSVNIDFQGLEDLVLAATIATR